MFNLICIWIVKYKSIYAYMYIHWLVHTHVIPCSSVKSTGINEY